MTDTDFRAAVCRELSRGDAFRFDHDPAGYAAAQAQTQAIVDAVPIAQLREDFSYLEGR